MPVQFNLAQMATLLSTVSHADMEYNVTRKNCYWFTCMVRELIIRIVNDAAAAAHQQISPNNIVTNYGTYLGLWPWHTGYFYGFFRLDGYSSELADVVYAEYRNEYQTFLNNVTLAL